MLAWGQSGVFRLDLAELEEAADQVAKLGKPLIVGLADGGAWFSWLRHIRHVFVFRRKLKRISAETGLNIYIVLRYIATDKPAGLIDRAAYPHSARRQEAKPAMKTPHSNPEHLRDFTTDARVLLVAAIAVIVATAGLFAGIALLELIRLFTNIAYFGQFTLAELKLQNSPLGHAAVLVPVAGSLIIGLMARYGSEKIRGHGIPEAIEAILLGRRRVDAKVAMLKPLSSAISIGTGGPFGAEGPIIMTGGAIGSLIAQMLPVSDNERKTLLVAGAAAGMTAVFGTPIAAVMLAVELLLFEWTPRSFIPVAVAAVVAEVAAHAAAHAGAALSVPRGMASSVIGLGALGR